MRYVFLVLLLSIFSASAYASCLEYQQISNSCALNKPPCYWKIPGPPFQYSVLANQQPSEDETVVSFSRTFWHAISNNSGSVDCFYKTSAGHLITLMQSDVGNVAKPNGSNWVASYWSGHKVLACSGAAASLCHFDYGN